MKSDFASRLTAMRRLYRWRLGMHDIPESEEGWMWKAIGHSMPPNSTRVRQPNSGDMALNILKFDMERVFQAGLQKSSIEPVA